jgi:hypothetical protein
VAVLTIQTVYVLESSEDYYAGDVIGVYSALWKAMDAAPGDWKQVKGSTSSWEHTAKEGTISVPYLITAYQLDAPPQTQGATQ